MNIKECFVGMAIYNNHNNEVYKIIDILGSDDILNCSNKEGNTISISVDKVNRCFCGCCATYNDCYSNPYYSDNHICFKPIVKN